MRFFKVASLVLVALVLTVSAHADPKPGGPRPGGGGPSPGGGNAPSGLVVNVQPEQMAQILTQAGFQSKAVDNGGTHMVRSLFWSEDIFSGLIPEVCDKDGPCHAYKLFANLGKDSGVNQAWIDAWNSRWLYVHATLSDGSLIFAWDVAVLTGVTPEYVASTAKLFVAIVNESTDFKP
jgi:hypothetical protein